MKIGICITCFNRPQYLKECLRSIENTLSSIFDDVILVDDASTDKEAIQLINNSGYKVIRKDFNSGIKQSLLLGCNYLFSRGADIVINLDSDAVVRNDFIERLLELHDKFPDKIVTGFNCRTKNKNGTERHIIIGEGDGYNIKKSVGGVNMCFDYNVYKKHIEPALLTKIGNWDHMACISAGEAYCAVPSVVQHIGVHSSMGHSIGGEPPDVADDFKPLALNNVTLVCATGVRVAEFEKAAEISSRYIHFGDIKILTSDPSSSKYAVNIRPLNSKEDYSRFILKELVNYIDTPYFILFQHDGYILNYKAWDGCFYDYDYIGAVWNWYKDGLTVGNGGFSFRSKKLHLALLDEKILPVNDPLIKEYNEDHNIARIYRKYLELTHDIKFAPEHIANKFSIEAYGVPAPLNKYNGSFGFHGYNIDFSGASIDHIPYLKTNPILSRTLKQLQKK